MKKILVVDDEELLRNTCVRILKVKNYEVDTAYNVKEAQKKLSKGKFNLVISDICLGEETGMILLRYIKENYAEIGVIMMTGGSEVSAAECRTAGAFDYISKPFEANDFLNMVDGFFFR